MLAHACYPASARECLATMSGIDNAREIKFMLGMVFQKLTEG
jgi:hypothetical protein